MDPLTAKFPAYTPYNSSNNNPLFFIDRTGGENIPALLWAYKNLIGVPWLTSVGNDGSVGVSWYVGQDAKNGHRFIEAHGFVAGARPQHGVCFDLTWTAYMNSSEGIHSYLSSTFESNTKAFTNSSNAFFGRANAKPWFMDDKDGRKFETDIKKGELGDLLFMGEDQDMHGHSVMLAGLPIQDVNAMGKETITVKTLSTHARQDGDDWVFDEREFTFMKNSDGKFYWTSQDGATQYEFKGYGQLDSKITDPSGKYKGVIGIFRKLIDLGRAKQEGQTNSSNTTQQNQ